VMAMAAITALTTLPACGRTGTGGPAASRTQAGMATVSRVVDGDTIQVRLASADEAEEKVRLIGIDTPETHGPGGLRECFGAEATSRAQALLPPGTQVRLVRDVEPRDRYGRLLAYIYRASDGLFVNLAMAAEGYATTLTYPPNVAHAKELGAATKTARDSGRGLWQRCGGPDAPVR
ncbi:MAG: thermonuclease family protein, partial [Actinomycetota bacterium]|nr:thermonuclease family protein [Actinomycetota bacterium]